jgi:hypothetical protein
VDFIENRTVTESPALRSSELRFGWSEREEERVHTAWMPFSGQKDHIKFGNFNFHFRESRAVINLQFMQKFYRIPKTLI